MTNYHTHHKIPRHAGGTDDPSNLIKLTVAEHAEAHRVLYEQNGDWQDKLAWKALSGQITMAEAQTLAMIEGRRKAGQKNKESGHMSRVGKNQPKEIKIANGIKSAAKCKELQVNAFWDPELRKEIAALGGKAQGKINGENGHCKNIIEDYWKDVKSGKIERKSFKWYSCDETKKSIQIKIDENVPPGFFPGRKY